MNCLMCAADSWQFGRQLIKVSRSHHQKCCYKNSYGCLFMTIFKNYFLPGVFWFRDDFSKALFLINVHEKLERKPHCWDHLPGIEDSSWFSYMNGKDLSVHHKLMSTDRMKLKIDPGRSIDLFESTWCWPSLISLSHVSSINIYVNLRE